MLAFAEAVPCLSERDEAWKQRFESGCLGVRVVGSTPAGASLAAAEFKK